MNEIAVVGAGGAVGREILSLLAERGYAKPLAFGSARSRGKLLPYGDQSLRQVVLWEENLANLRVALFAAGGDVSREWAAKFTDSGVVVVDNSSAFRLQTKIALVVPEINSQCIAAGSKQGARVIANPNCSTIILVLALHPLRALGNFRVICSTYQAVSGAGRDGLVALEREQSGGEFEQGAPFPFPIASNVIPLIGAIDPKTGATEEEAKMIEESRKILNWPDLEIHVSCVRVPVARCHSESVTLIFDEPIELAEARERLHAAPGIEVFDDPLQPPQPAPLAGTHPVAVGRLRQPSPHCLQFWLVGDQLLKGAALNAVQIAEHVLQDA